MKTYAIREKDAEGDEVQQIDINEISNEINRLAGLEKDLKARIKESM